MRTHAWTGLVAGPLVLVLGLSGAALVFRAELDDLLAPSPRLAVGGAASSLDGVVRAALLPHPGAVARALRIAADPTRPYRVEVMAHGRRLDVDVEPSTLRVLAARAPERSALAAVHALHAGFHAGRAGALVVGLVGLWLAVEGLSGLALYGRGVAPMGARRRASRAVHRVVGALSLTAGLLLGVTGALLAFGNALTPAGADVSPARSLARVDAVAAGVAAAAPGARIAAIIAEGDDVIRVDVRSATGEPRTLRLAATSGAVVAVATQPTTSWEVVRRLHAGDFGGPLVRALYAAFALALAVLALTGFVIAARRQSSKVLT